MKTEKLFENMICFLITLHRFLYFFSLAENFIATRTLKSFSFLFRLTF
jgi:hypothetical protein